MCRLQIHKGGGVRAGRPAWGQSAFTVTELMVAVSLMSVIVFALFTMFNQVQKALRANVSQVDSTERGRAVLELVSRELEAARVSMRPEVTNFWIKPQAQIIQPAPLGDIITDAASILRTNLFDYVYYQGKLDKAWRGVGFAVLESTTNTTGQAVFGPAANGIGTLVRYETPEVNREYYHPTTNLFKGFVTNIYNVDVNPLTASTRAVWPLATNLAHVAEGVVHFKLLPYDTRGRMMDFYSTNRDPAYRIVRVAFDAAVKPFPDSYFAPEGGTNDIGKIDAANVALRSSEPLAQPFFTTASFRSNAMPAYVELELGVLEPDAMRRYDQMVKDGQTIAAKDYLKKRIANVQIFRKRIPFRTVVP